MRTWKHVHSKAQRILYVCSQENISMIWGFGEVGKCYFINS